MSTTTKTLTIDAGITLEDSIIEAIDKIKMFKDVSTIAVMGISTKVPKYQIKFNFNNIELLAKENDTVDSLKTQYYEKIKKTFNTTITMINADTQFNSLVLTAKSITTPNIQNLFHEYKNYIR